MDPSFSSFISSLAHKLNIIQGLNTAKTERLSYRLRTNISDADLWSLAHGPSSFTVWLHKALRLSTPHYMYLKNRGYNETLNLHEGSDTLPPTQLLHRGSVLEMG